MSALAVPPAWFLALVGKFPAKYQRAFYICDWTYGRLIAVHLSPEWRQLRRLVGELRCTKILEGQEWESSAEPDRCCDRSGWLLPYFTVGGRGTQANLFRVTYTGAEAVAPLPATALQGWQRGTQVATLWRRRDVATERSPLCGRTFRAPTGPFDTQPDSPSSGIRWRNGRRKHFRKSNRMPRSQPFWRWQGWEPPTRSQPFSRLSRLSHFPA